MIFLYLLLAVILLFYVYMTWNFDYWSKRGVPSAKATFLLGNLPNLLLRRKHVSHDFDKLYNEFKGKTPFVGILQFRQPRLLILEPTVIKDVIIRNFKNFHDSEFGDMINKDTDPLFSRNPFMLKGEEWKEKRAEITPAFTASRLKTLYPLMEEVQGHMAKYIEKLIPTKEPFDARELCAKYTTDVVASSIFGVDAQSFTKESPEIREMGRKLMAPNAFNLMKMFAMSTIPALKMIMELRFVSDDVEKFFINLMEQALKYRKDNNIQREDFLDYLIQLREKKGLKDIDMASHTITFFTDGFETSSIAIANALYELGRNKQVQDKLRDEISQNCEHDGKINFETLNDMPYLDQVFHESLRLHTLAPFNPRQCTEPIELSYEGVTAKIEKGINVYIPVQALHSDPEYYPEPETFMPERFDPENGGLKAFKDKGVFLAFGDGPRMCLGMRFAVLQSKVVIAGIVRDFEISVNPKTPEKLIIDPQEFFNVKKGGLWLDFKRVTSL